MEYLQPMNGSVYIFPHLEWSKKLNIETIFIESHTISKNFINKFRFRGLEKIFIFIRSKW